MSEMDTKKYHEMRILREMGIAGKELKDMMENKFPNMSQQSERLDKEI